MPIIVPEKVKVNVSGNVIKLEGPKGKLEKELNSSVKIEVKDGKILFTVATDSKTDSAYHGLVASLVKGMVIGVTDGFSKTLDLVGVGYRALQRGKNIEFFLGFSHPIVYLAPGDVTLKAVSQTRVTVEGCDKQLVGQIAAEIRALKKPEPYKGKGVKYENEFIRRKVGKAGNA